MIGVANEFDEIFPNCCDEKVFLPENLIFEVCDDMSLVSTEF